MLRTCRASRRGNPGAYHLDLGVEIFDWLEIVDAGDAHCPHGSTERSHANIRAKVGTVAGNGVVPIVIGGDHSITWPSATAVAEAVGWGSVGIVHVDAHADTADSIDGNLASHGTPMRRLIEPGAVRGMACAADGRDAIYLSVDIDVLDPGFAPGTGTPEPGGMNAADLLRAVRRVALETNLVAMDVVEVAPAYDHADVTVNNAHRVVLECLAAMAHHKRAAAGGAPDLPGRLPG